MEADFWHQRWQDNQIGFHESQPNPALVTHFSALSLNAHCRIFVPLCGKTLDIHWLLEKGCHVVGVELSPIAISQLFEALGLSPTITQCGKLQAYSATNITVYVGDIFALTSEQLGHIDAVYDRAALIALPAPMRRNYAQHLIALAPQASQLLICLVYDQTVMNGPPFSIDRDTVNAYYSEAYNVSMLQTKPIAGGLKGKCPADENVWLLKKK